MIQEALGADDVTATDRQAVTYAVAHGVPVVASAADEEAEHHNLPVDPSRHHRGNSVTKDTSYKPPSYLYLNGCTNYGANISVSVESASCSSEATGKAVGDRRSGRVGGGQRRGGRDHRALPRTHQRRAASPFRSRPTRSPSW